MKVRKLQSLDNPVVRHAMGLLGPAKARRSAGELLIEGPHLLGSAADAGAGISRVFVTEGIKGQLARTVRRLEARGAEIYEINDKVIKALAATETPQGVFATVSIDSEGLGDVVPGAPIVVLDGVQDPGNVGTIIRTAHAAGAAAVVVLGGTADPHSPKCLRASAGSVFHVPVIFGVRKTLGDELKALGYALVVTDAQAGHSLYGSDMPPMQAFVFGNESHGVSATLRSAARVTLHLPVSKGAESLNVASAAAVFLYEARRRADKR